MDNKLTLSIIIPYYEETREELFPVLAGINGQLGIDHSKIECILVNDGNCGTLTEEFLHLFTNLTIRCVTTGTNKGPGMARQTGIDLAGGEYVMFCDADDSLSGMFVLDAFLREITQYHPELILSSWLEEHYDGETGVYQYAQHDIDFTWMHGKAFSRAFLQEKNIRFREDLTIHEDNYFMALVFSEAENIRKIQASTYVWRNRPDSITRRNNAAFIYETVPEFVKSTGYVLEEIEKRHPEQMPTCVARSIINVYFILHRKEWKTPERSTLLREAEQVYGEMLKPYLHYYKNMPDSAVAAMYNQERAVSFVGEIKTERLDDWLERTTGPGLQGKNHV